jgi:hypothetical protein
MNLLLRTRLTNGTQHNAEVSKGYCFSILKYTAIYTAQRCPPCFTQKAGVTWPYIKEKQFEPINSAVTVVRNAHEIT